MTCINCGRALANSGERTHTLADVDGEMPDMADLLHKGRHRGHSVQRFFLCMTDRCTSNICHNKNSTRLTSTNVLCFGITDLFPFSAMT